MRFGHGRRSASVEGPKRNCPPKQNSGCAVSFTVCILPEEQLMGTRPPMLDSWDNVKYGSQRVTNQNTTLASAWSPVSAFTHLLARWSYEKR